MGVFIFMLFIVGLYFYFKSKKSKSKIESTNVVPEQKIIDPIDDLKSKIKIEVSYDSGYQFKDQLQPIEQDESQNWILNPGTPFNLTVLSSDYQIAASLRNILENNELFGDKKIERLVELLSEKNIKIKQIEDYKNKYQKLYFDFLEKQKINSTIWSTSGEKDKEDILIEFQINAINNISEQANCDLPVLFENEPKDLTLDDELLNEYSYDLLKIYLRYSYKIDGVLTISSDHYARKSFEELHARGLAYWGKEIPKEEILKTLTLKQLNAIAMSDKEYKRKNQAIDFILQMPDSDDIIGNHIALRELFKLKPLPSKYNHIDIEQIAKNWQYHEEEAKLLMNTFNNSYSAKSALVNASDTDVFVVHNYFRNNKCKCAIDREGKKYNINNIPQVPCHIGCDCVIIRDYGN